MTDNRYGSKPLGKSVEEVQEESGNRVNSPVEGEVVRAEQDKLIPAIVNGNATGTHAVINPDALIEPGSDAEDGTAQARRDSDSTSE